ncbi:beta-glucuronidase isoform X2 [Bacillus rossius redtenbacheri]
MAAVLVLGAAVLGAAARDGPGGGLYPRQSESRDVRSLDGVWDFRLSPESDPLLGFREHWYSQPLRQTGPTAPMPVPASYNDVTQLKEVRDHVGLAWYDRSFFVPAAWRLPAVRVWLRFGSVHYTAHVWLNGQLVMTHEGGHLPFQRDVSSVLKHGASNLLTVAVDNTLLETSVPQGRLKELHTDNGTRIVQTYTFDFFNYAGIHRPVLLHTTPATYVDDVSVQTNLKDSLGVVEYNVTIGGTDPSEEMLCQVTLMDRDGKPVVNGTPGLQGRLEVNAPQLWWPRLMHLDPGYLYTLQVRLEAPHLGTTDVYRLPIGLRTLQWNSTAITINQRPLYMRGFGKHEDADIRGKGLDLVTAVKDYNLMEWIGGNTFRTSHYPYSEEVMEMADRRGFMVVDESPSVDTVGFSSVLLEKHKAVLSELVRRDRNHPSVVMWSVSNEARTHLPAAEAYFESVVQHVRQLDSTRPVTFATARGFWEDKAAQFMDVIGFNRYNAWYSNPGRTDTIRPNVVQEAEGWHRAFHKPVFMSEYGADTMPGLHLSPAYIWSEEYQVEVLSEHFRAFDELRGKGFFVGEMVWNFADFNTAQTYTRVGGNKKGVFTRARQPKAGAHHVRRRYLALAQELDLVTPPEDVRSYVLQPCNCSRTRDEL